MDDKKLFKKAKNIFTSLKTDPSSVLFSEEKIDSKLFKKTKEIKICKGQISVTTCSFS